MNAAISAVNTKLAVCIASASPVAYAATAVDDGNASSYVRFVAFKHSLSPYASLVETLPVALRTMRPNTGWSFGQRIAAHRSLYD